MGGWGLGVTGWVTRDAGIELEGRGQRAKAAMAETGFAWRVTAAGLTFYSVTLL